MKKLKSSLLVCMSCFVLLANGCKSPNFFVGNDVAANTYTNEKLILKDIEGIDIDNDGNLYVADSGNNQIKKITPEGTISVFIGSGKKGDKDGKKEDAELNYPTDVKFDSNNDVYIADTNNKKIKILHNDLIISLDINLDINTSSSTRLFFDSNGQLNLFGGQKLTFSKDLKSYVTDDFYSLGVLGYVISDIFTNKRTGKSYVICDSTNYYSSRKFLYTEENGKYVDITSKYNKKPYPESNIINLAFDDDENIYIFYANGLISKTSKEGQYIKTYSAIRLSFLPLSFISYTIVTYPYNNIVIDNKRKILYFTANYAIYKVNIN